MNAHVNVELLEPGQFFAPVASDLVDRLIGQFNAKRDAIHKVAEIIGEYSDAVRYFIAGNKDDDSRYSAPGLDKLFCVDGAMGDLRADFWSRAINLTDALDLMPQKRRDEWFEQIRNPLGVKANPHRGTKEVPPLPEFDEESVRSTLLHLLNSRQQFFCERIDGIFRALSSEHLTNRPEGFSKRMIVANMFSFYGGGFVTSNSSRMGVVNDLRCVIARFMGREELKHGASDRIIEDLRSNRSGEWQMLDGGALRIRVYLKGTAHLEVHPDIAWRLNQMLASMYPAAIPSEFRQPPKRKAKEWKTLQRPLPTAVVSMLAALEPANRWYEKNLQKYKEQIPDALAFGYRMASEDSKPVREEAEAILRAIGGVPAVEGKGYQYWQFPYNPRPVINEIVASGCIPDQKSHQFYPTPEWLAARCVEQADIDETHNCLEPSAGHGGIADLLPKDRTDCVEISPLHQAILETKGFRVVKNDFLSWRGISNYDRIVMNPPFSEGRAEAHVRHAAKMLKPGGRLVAIVPAGMRSKPMMPDGWQESWSPLIENAFPGVSVSVAIYQADAPAS